MAMSGETYIDINSRFLLPKQDLVYDWLDAHDVSWRVYHEGIPFFAMMPRWIPKILDGDQHFRRFTLLEQDLEERLPQELPKVFFIEPSYTDAPHAGILTSDDHAPSGARGGQEFLLKVYRAFSDKNPGLWKNTVMIVTYDEHGGFFDHVSPPDIPTLPPPGLNYRPFASLGVRVPAFIVSPFVKEKTVYSHTLDHTSILKFISQVFADGHYSIDVDRRPVNSVFDVLDSTRSTGPAPVAPNLVKYHAAPVGFVPGKSPKTKMEHCFKNALDAMRAHSVDGTRIKLGDVVGPFL
jgi:phospholipase C